MITAPYQPMSIRNAGYHSFFQYDDDKNASAVIDVSFVPGPSPGLDYGYVNRVFVHQKLRGRGVASGLFKRLTEAADSEQLTLYIDPTTNYGSSVPRLIALFQRFGFEIVDDAERGRMRRFYFPRKP